MTVLPSAEPALELAVRQATSVVDTQGGDAVVDVANVGRGTTASGLTVTIPQPTGAAVSQAAGDHWTCTGTSDTPWVCTQSGTVGPGRRLPALDVKLATTDSGTAQALLTATAADSTSGVSSQGEGAIGLLHTTVPVLGLVSSLPLNTRIGPKGTLRYDLSVRNAGTAPEQGDLEISYTYPPGSQVVASPAPDSGWTCKVSTAGGGPVKLDCLRPPASGSDLSPGSSSPAVPVSVRMPAQLQGAVLLSGHASSGLLDPRAFPRLGRLAAATIGSFTTAPTVSSQQTQSVAVQQIATQSILASAPADGVTIDTTLGAPASSPAVPLQRGESGYLAVHVVNTSTADQPTGALIGLQLPAGISPTGSTQSTVGLSIGKSGTRKPPVLGCTAGGTSTTSGITPYLCHDSADLPASAGFEVDIPVAVAATAPDAPEVVAGVMAPGASLTDVAHGSFQGWSRQLPLTVHGIEAVPELEGQPALGGTPPEVPSAVRTTDAHGVPSWQSNVITLDGSRSTGSGSAPLTYTWAELAGPPAVSPNGSAKAAMACTVQAGRQTCRKLSLPNGVDPPAGSTVFYGAHPQITLPAVPAKTPFVFELWVTDGTQVVSATTTVEVDASPEQPPVISSATALTGGTQLAAYTAAAANAAPVTSAPARPAAPVAVPAGSCVSLTASARSPLGYPLTWTWHVSVPGTPPTPLAVQTCGSASGSGYGFVWPSGDDILLVSATVDDGHGGTATQDLTLGVPPTPLTLDLPLPGTFPASGAVPGTRYTLTAAPHGGDGTAGGLQWSDCSASQPGVTVVSTSGDTAVVTVPAATGPGQSKSVCVSLAQGGEAATVASATLAIPLAAPSALGVAAAAGSSSVSPSGTTGLTATPSGGVPPYTYTWSATAGSVSPGDAATSTYTAPASGTSDTVGVVVEDSAGSTATAAVKIAVGSAPAATTAAGCGAGSLLGDAVAALSAQTPKDVSVTMGWGTADLGTISGSIACSAPYAGTIRFDGASFSIGPGLVTGTGLSGTIKASAGTGSTPAVTVCLAGGSVSLPSSWQLPSATLSATAPLCLDGNATGAAAGGLLSGKATFAGAPFLPLGAVGGQQPSTALTFDGSTITVGVTGGLLGGSATLTGCYALAAGGCTSVSAQGLAAGTTAFTASLTGAKVFGVALTNADGTLTVPAAGAPTYDLSFAVGGATIAPGVSLTSGKLELDGNGLTLDAQGAIGPYGKAVAVDVSGSFTDSSHWALAVSGSPSGQCTSWSGTSIDLSCLRFVGTLQDAGSSPTFSVSASLAKWNVSSELTVNDLTVQLSNGTAPAACTPQASGSDPNPSSVVTAGDVYLAVSGDGSLALPGVSTIPIQASACVDPSSGSFLVAAGVTDWQPAPGVDATLDSASVDAVYTGGTLSFVGSGKATVAGEQLGATVTYDTASQNLVVDGYGNLGTLLPGVNASAHVVYSTEAVQGYTLWEPGSPTAGTSTVDLPGNGLTIAVDFALPNPSDPGSGPVGTVLKKLGFSGPPSVVVSAQISASGIDLVGSLQTDAVVFGVCQTTGSNVQLTQTPTSSCLSLKLRDLFVELSTDGTIGFGADTILNIPSSSGPADLDLRMEMAVQLPAKVTASFELKGMPGASAPASCSSTTGSYTDTAGHWCNALFVPGLEIGTFAIQGSIDFSTGIPTPNIGVYASGIVLPPKLNNLLGIQNDGETMTFGLNVSATAPVLDVELGQADGRPFLEPLQNVSSAVAPAVQVDDADLVFAPIGGRIAGVEIPPGLGLSFDANLLGDAVHVAAHVGLSPTPSVSASAYVSALPLPQFGIVLQNVDVALGFGAGITPAAAPSASQQAPCAASVADAVPHGSGTFSGFYLAASGSAGLVPGLPSACLALGVRADASGIALEGGGSLDDWGLGSLISLKHLGFAVKAGPIALGSSGAGALDAAATNLVPSVAITVQGSGEFLGAQASVAGNVSLGAGGISAANLTLATQAVSYHGLQIGADTSAACPTIVTGPGVAAPTAGGGPFVQLVYAGGSNSSFQASFSGAVGFGGTKASGCGSISSDGASFTGDLDLSALVDAKVNVSGAFYWGTPQPGQLVVTDTPCNGATTCYDGYLEQQAQQNDWYVAMGGDANLALAGFSVDGQFGAGSVGGAQYLHLNGGLTVGTASTGASVQGSADVSYANGAYSYDFVGAGSVELNGYTLSNVAVDLSPRQLALAGKVAVGGTTVTVSGTVATGSGSLSAPCNFTANLPGYTQLAADPNNDVGTAPGGVAFCLYGTASIPLFGGTLDGSAMLDNSGFTLDGRYAFPLGGTVAFAGGIYPDGTADGTVDVSGISLFGNSVSGTVGACVGNCLADVNENEGVWWDATAYTGVGALAVTGYFTDPGNFSLSASLDNQGGSLGTLDLGVALLGGDASYDISGTVSQNGFSLGDSNLSLDFWYETPTLSCNFSNGCSTGWSDPNNVASATGAYDASTGQVCVAASVAGVFSIPDPRFCA